MSGGSHAYGDGDSYFSSVSHDHRGSIARDSDADDRLSRLLSQTPPSQLSEADTKLLLATMAKQQDLIRRLSRQLRQRATTTTTTGEASMAQTTPLGASTSLLKGDKPSSGKRRLVSFTESAATPPSLLLQRRDQREATPSQLTWPHMDANSLSERSQIPTLSSFPSVNVVHDERKRKPYTASMIDRLCDGFGEEHIEGGAPNGGVQTLNRTVEKSLFSGSGVDDPSGSTGQQAQLAETDVTESSLVMPNTKDASFV